MSFWGLSLGYASQGLLCASCVVGATFRTLVGRALSGADGGVPKVGILGVTPWGFFCGVAVCGFTASFEDSLSGVGGDGVLGEIFFSGCLSGRVCLRLGITLVTAFLLSQELKQHLSRCSGLEFNDIFVVRIWGVMSP